MARRLWAGLRRLWYRFWIICPDCHGPLLTVEVMGERARSYCLACEREV